MKEYQFRDVSDVLHDEEHKTYSVTFTDSQGAVRKIDWALASTAGEPPDAGQARAVQGPAAAAVPTSSTPPRRAKAEAEEEAEEVASEEGVAADAAAPGTAAETKPAKRNSKVSQDPVEKKTAREVFEYVIEQGKKEYQVQRYKGLGEMTAPQLWETTMDPERRTLLQVTPRRHRRVRGDLHHPDGRRRRTPPQVHRRERTGREEPGHLSDLCYYATAA